MRGYHRAIDRTLAICGIVIAVAFSAPPVRAAFNEIKLTASDRAISDDFGVSVALSGNRALVGAFADNDAGNDSGSAYIFDVVTGSELLKLTASDAAADDQFGFSVDMSGNTVLIGAPLEDVPGTDSGSAYLISGTTGQVLFKLTASDAAGGDNFGWDVAVDGNTGLVSAPFDNNARGAAYLYNATTGQQLFKLVASDADDFDLFGYSAAISGNVALVGAVTDEENGENSGSAYLFNATTGQQLFKLAASDAAENDFFGRSVAVSGNVALVGAYRKDDEGAAYLFDVTTGQELFKLAASDAATNGT